MASKPVMVTAPLVVLLYDRMFLAASLRAAFRDRKTLYLGLASTWVLLALLLWVGAREYTASAGFVFSFGRITPST